MPHCPGKGSNCKLCAYTSRADKDFSLNLYFLKSVSLGRKEEGMERGREERKRKEGGK